MANAPGTATNEGTYSQQFVVSYSSPVSVQKPRSGQILAFQDHLRNLASSDFDLLNRIIMCESGYQPKAQNPTSSAGGIFQFIDSTWNAWGEGDKMDPYKNIEAGVRLFNAQGTRPWKASQHCWDR